MGSQSDYSTMKYCEKVLKILKIKFEKKIISAHRTPKRMFEYAKNAETNNISVIKMYKKNRFALLNINKNYYIIHIKKLMHYATTK